MRGSTIIFRRFKNRSPNRAMRLMTCNNSMSTPTCVEAHSSFL
jgi:hypothetical protein